MDGWKKERAGEGRYHVRGADGVRRPGIVLGGGRRWTAELCGRQMPEVYTSAAAACHALFIAGDDVYRRR